MTRTFQQWQHMAVSLQIEARCFIDGTFTPAEGGATFACHSPIDGRKLADVSAAQPADVERAVAAARASFDSGVWSQISPRERKGVLLRWGTVDPRTQR